MKDMALGASIALIGGIGLWAGADIASGDSGSTDAGAVENFETGDGVVKPGENFAAKVEVLGAAIQSGDDDMMVTMRVMVGDGSFEPFGGLEDAKGGNVNDGERHAALLPGVYDAETTIRVAAQSWDEDSDGWDSYLTVRTSESSQQVKVLRNGDAAPDIQPFKDQATIVSFLTDYIDADTGLVTLDANQAIYLFELGTTRMSSSAADFQDLVVLVSLAEDHSYFDEFRAIEMPEFDGRHD